MPADTQTVRQELEDDLGPAYRLRYRNGDDIGLAACGCDGCTPSSINGTLCHEQGCPDARRDRKGYCPWCGQAYYPTEPGNRFCDDDCASAYHG